MSYPADLALRPSPTPPVAAHSFPVRAFFGHHKCATGWIDGILMEVSFHLGRHCRIVHTPRYFAPHDSLAALAREETVEVLAYTNADPAHVADLSFYRGFHVVRDPRDIVVSAYFSHLYSHDTADWPALAAHREALQRLSKSEGLLREIDFSRPQFEHMVAWDYAREDVLELKMEFLTAGPVAGFMEVARFLELLDEHGTDPFRERLRMARLRMNRLNHRGRRFMPRRMPLFPVPRHPQHTIPPSLLEEIVLGKSFRRLSGGRRQGQENVHSHYRKGVPGDWKNHFEEVHIHRFKKEFNDLLLMLGYETDPDW